MTHKYCRLYYNSMYLKIWPNEFITNIDKSRAAKNTLLMVFFYLTYGCTTDYIICNFIIAL